MAEHLVYLTPEHEAALAYEVERRNAEAVGMAVSGVPRVTTPDQFLQQQTEGWLTPIYTQIAVTLDTVTNVVKDTPAEARQHALEAVASPALRAYVCQRLLSLGVAL